MATLDFTTKPLALQLEVVSWCIFKNLTYTYSTYFYLSSTKIPHVATPSSHPRYRLSFRSRIRQPLTHWDFYSITLHGQLLQLNGITLMKIYLNFHLLPYITLMVILFHHRSLTYERKLCSIWEFLHY